MSNIVKITKAKKKSKNHFRFLGLLLIISIVCFFLLSPIFAIEDIEVIGNNLSAEKYIISSSGILYGENILRINKFDAIEKINSIPTVEYATIKREWPNKVIITVNEKVAIAEVGFYGSKLLISENGDVMSVVTDDKETNLPVLEGITVKDVTAGEKLVCKEEEKLEKYLEVLKKLKENGIINNVVKLTENDGILVSFDIGHVAFLGDIDNLQYKISLIKEIWKKEENPAYIDLHNLEKIITKPVWGVLEENKNEEVGEIVEDDNKEQTRGAADEE